MKRLSLIISVLLFFQYTIAQVRTSVNIDDNWRFCKCYEINVELPEFDDSAWDIVNLPHTWNALDGQDGGNDYYRGIGWYRRSVLISGDLSDNRIFLRFGSANIVAGVYINGTLVGNHQGGFAAFIFDITDLLISGVENTIAVKVDNSSGIDIAPLSGDFTFFGGLTRSVELLVTEKVCISPEEYASSGIYITPHNISEGNASIGIKTLVANYHETEQIATVSVVIRDPENNKADSTGSTIVLPSGSTNEVIHNMEVVSPVLWNGIKNAGLYSAEVKLLIDDIIFDSLVQNFGIRYYNVDADLGFFLNGESYPLHGVAFHEDRHNKGRAVSDLDRNEDLSILREMGCNFLRLAHYQHGQYTYNYCDSAGIILWTEVPLINNISSSTEFSDNIKQQLNELIHQNYNHPSVFFWGLFNEINYQSGPDPAPLIGELNDIAHEADSMRHTCAAAMHDERATNWIPDLISWNKYFGWYYGEYDEFAEWAENMHTSHSGSKIGVSEYGVGASPNHHEEDPFKPIHYGPWHPEEYQNLFHEAHYMAVDTMPYLWSTAVWVGFDFSSDGRAEGELHGINDKGLVTQDRSLKKDAFYFYKAQWSDSLTTYITSRRYTERTDSITSVKVYSNADSVGLRVNENDYGFIKSLNGIFIWHEVELDTGLNKIWVNGLKDPESVLDSCYWEYLQGSGSEDTDTIYEGEIQINFQNSATETPEGYYADIGSVYGNRGNGMEYGWSVNNTASARNRGGTEENMVFYTLNHMQNSGTKTWEIAVGNGLYRVSLACGDPEYYDSYHKIEIEGKVVLEGQPNPERLWIMSTDTIEVLDEKLTVSPASGGINTKINLIHITCIECDEMPVFISAQAAESVLVHEIFPNPASDLISIRLDISEKALYTVSITGMTGSTFILLKDKFFKPGLNTINLSLEGVPSGYYILTVRSDKQVFSMSLAKK
ncbi:MAG: T9SS type A sorting domain-containing protein [Bacteroidales bacterium]|nr:T9SS type A sorting domain-containing protein [Bacteroidales bacterium]